MAPLLVFLMAVSSQSDLCHDEEFAGAAVLASAALEEDAEELKVSEDRAGMVLLTWRIEACQLMQSNYELYESTRQAIARECSSREHLEERDSQVRARRILEVIEERSPNIVALAWGVRNPESGQIVHRVIVSDTAFSANFTIPGYGRNQDFEPECSVTSSDWYSIGGSEG
jgi:hypothetical protein